MVAMLANVIPAFMKLVSRYAHHAIILGFIVLILNKALVSLAMEY